MDKKKLYAFFAILIIITLIIIWFSRESVKINDRPFPQEVNPEQQQPQEQNALPGSTQDLSVAADNSLGITVIKKPSFDKKIPLTEGAQEGSKIEKGEASDQAIERNYDHISGEPLNESFVNPASGVTKINKRPTEEESKEMNARGIILY